MKKSNLMKIVSILLISVMVMLFATTVNAADNNPNNEYDMVIDLIGNNTPANNTPANNTPANNTPKNNTTNNNVNKNN